MRDRDYDKYDRRDTRDYREYTPPEDYRRRVGRPRMEDDYDEMEMRRGGSRRRRDSRGRYMSMGYDDEVYEPDIWMEDERPKIGFGSGRDYERGYVRAENRRSRMRKMYDDDGISNEDGEHWMHGLVNSDGSGTGAHWNMEQTRKVYEENKIKEKSKGEIDERDFYYTLNMVYADYAKVAKENNVNSVKFYVDMTLAFLLDDDFRGEPSEKLEKYYFNVVDGE